MGAESLMSKSPYATKGTALPILTTDPCSLQLAGGLHAVARAQHSQNKNNIKKLKHIEVNTLQVMTTFILATLLFKHLIKYIKAMYKNILST